MLALVGNVSVCLYLPVVIVHVQSSSCYFIVGHQVQLFPSKTSMSCSLQLVSTIRSYLDFFLLPDTGSTNLPFSPHLNLFMDYLYSFVSVSTLAISINPILAFPPLRVPLSRIFLEISFIPSHPCCCQSK